MGLCDGRISEICLYPLSWWPKWSWWWTPSKPTAKPNPENMHKMNYTLYKAKCDSRISEICLYPLLCLCPKYDVDGYVRTKYDRWYYNTTTSRCENRTAVAGGCNDFETSEQSCLRGADYPCAYPDVCSQCPPNVTDYPGHTFFYYAPERNSCVRISGTTDNCNGFVDDDSCRTLCGLDDYD
ncbi:hypothetical protein MRX96_036191 [Rhipicephalus microplus]